jgi:hypothetical protein
MASDGPDGVTTLAAQQSPFCALNLGVTNSLRGVPSLRSIEALDFADETINATIDAYLADFPSGIGHLGCWLEPAASARRITDA